VLNLFIVLHMLYLSWGPVSVLDWDNWGLDWLSGFWTESTEFWTEWL